MSKDGWFSKRIWLGGAFVFLFLSLETLHFTGVENSMIISYNRKCHFEDGIASSNAQSFGTAMNLPSNPYGDPGKFRMEFTAFLPMKKKPTQKLSRVQNWSFSIASSPAFTRGRRGMKRNASGPLEVCGRDMSMFSHGFTLPLGLIHLNSTAKNTDGVRQNDFHWHGICSSKIPTVHFSTEAAWCKRNLTGENSRDRIQTCRQGLWWVLVQSHAKFKVAQSGRIFMQNSCCPCFEVQLDRKQNLAFNMHVCNVCRRQPGMTCGVVPQNCPWIGCLNPHFFSIKFGAKLPLGTCFPMCVGALRKLERMRWSWIAVWAKLGAPNIRMVAALNTKYIKLWKSGGYSKPFFWPAVILGATSLVAHNCKVNLEIGLKPSFESKCMCWTINYQPLFLRHLIPGDWPPLGVWPLARCPGWLGNVRDMGMAKIRDMHNIAQWWLIMGCFCQSW